MRRTRRLASIVLFTLLATACDAMGPGPGRPFAEDRQYVLRSDTGVACTPGTGDACPQTLELHADGSARVPYASQLLEATYEVRGSRVDVTPNAAGTGAMRFDLSDGGNTLTEHASGRVWIRYELMRHLSRVRALA